MKFLWGQTKSTFLEGRLFIFAVKRNRKVALSKEDKENGHYVSIRTLESEGRSLVV